MNGQDMKQTKEVQLFRKVELLWLALLLLALSAATGCRVSDAEGQQPDAVVQREYRLRTAMADGRMVFLGAGGDIDGAVNPELAVYVGETVRVVLENGDGMMHDLAIPGLPAQTPTTMRKGDEVEALFTAESVGTFPYFCTVSGHRRAGMEGTLTVTDRQWR